MHIPQKKKKIKLYFFKTDIGHRQDVNETEKQNTHGCAKLSGYSVRCENEGAPSSVHSEMSCARQDEEVLSQPSWHSYYKSTALPLQQPVREQLRAFQVIATVQTP